MKSPFLLALVISCSAISCEDKIGQQIQAIFTKNMDLEKETAIKMEELIQFRNKINVQGRALTEDEISLVEEMNAVEKRWQDWGKAFHARDLIHVEEKDREAFLEEQHRLYSDLKILHSDIEGMLSSPF